MTSTCCDAKPLEPWSVNEMDGEMWGICSDCRENAEFKEEIDSDD